MAANSIAKLAVLITGDATPLKSTLTSAAGAVQAFAGAASSAGSAGGAFTSILGGAALGPIAATAAGVAALTAGMARFAQVGLTAAANMEQLRISFEVMTGSVKTANDLIADMQRLSLETPLEIADVQQAGKTLIAMGEPVSAIIHDLKMLGDVAAGTGQPLNELSQVFGQVMQAGRLTGNELRQFNERGVPLLTTLSAQMGVSKQAIRDMVEAGKIGADDVVKAFEAMTGSGGKFANMMERQTDTLIGQWNKFKENITFIAMQVMAPMAEALKQILMLINAGLDGLAKLFGRGASGGAYKTGDTEATKRYREQEKAQKDAETAASRAADELKKKTDEMQKRGEAMAKSLRSPIEVMRDSFREMVELFNVGAISWETLQRGISKASDDFERAAKSAKEINEATKPLAAYQRFSVGAFSAAQAASRESDKAAQVAKQQLEVEKQSQKELELVNKQLRDRPVNTLRIARLN
jgi:tape measure domain-containing protein